MNKTNHKGIIYLEMHTYVIFIWCYIVERESDKNIRYILYICIYNIVKGYYVLAMIALQIRKTAVHKV